MNSAVADNTTALKPSGHQLGWFEASLVLITLAPTLADAVAIKPLLAEWIGSLRPQLSLLIFAILLVATIRRRRRLRWLMTLQLLWHVQYFGVLLIPDNQPEPSTRTAAFSVCSVNIKAGNTRPELLFRSLPKQLPNLLIIIELSPELDQSLQKRLHETHPHHLTAPKTPASFGIGIYSQYPILDSDVLTFGAPEVPTLSVLLQTPEGPVRVIGTHPPPPLNSEMLRLRNRQLWGIAQLCRNYRREQSAEPLLLIGDLNITPWVSTWSGLLNESNLQNTLNRSNLFSTWRPMELPGAGMIIDHALVSANLTCVERRVLPDCGSDHLPLFTRYRMQNASNH